VARQRNEPEEGAAVQPEDEDGPPRDDEVHDEDFQFVLKELLAGYEPVLAEELERARDPERLKKEALEHPPSCEDERALANRIFERFVTEEVSLRLLTPEARQQLGSVEEWRWCLRHIRCCIIFGWLVCRGPRTFRSFNYYLWRYWLCVRQTLGDAPGDRPPTDEEREDFTALVRALAGAYQPYLTDQLATVEFPLGLPDEIIGGKIDCDEGQDESAAIFERLLTADIGPALLGRKAFEEHSRHPSFWFCRCWCLCAIRFGCCLAQARSLIDVLRCLVFYRRCLRRCFRPLFCEITRPALDSCADEEYFGGPKVLGVEIVGSAGGAFCDHYILEWKPAGAPDTAYTQTSIVYAGGSPTGPGPCGVSNSTLGWLDTASNPVPDAVAVRLCVYGTTGAPACCTTEFQIFRQRVWIKDIEGVQPGPNGILDASAQLETGTTLRAFGTALEIDGRAWAGKCEGREIKRYTLSFQSGFVTDPLVGPWTQFWQVDYLSPLQRKEIQTNDFDLTSFWVYDPIVLPSPPFPPGTSIPKDWLTPTHWWSGNTTPVPPQQFPVDPQAGPTWTAQQLPTINCQSGRYTLLLDVEDTTGAHYYDTQQVWFDNKSIYGKITQIGGVPACATINLSQFAAAGGDCSVPWLANLLGIAYDEFIEEGNGAIPSDNYAMVGGVVQGGYALWIKKDGAPDPGVQLPVPGPLPWTPPTNGTTRVGDPGLRCATAAPPPGPVGPETPGILASLDLRRLDAICNPGETDLTLARRGPGHPDGECCGYVARLLVWDNSVCPALSGGRHQIEHHFPFCICNDLKEPQEGLIG